MKTIQIKFGDKQLEFTDWDQLTLFSAKQQAEQFSDADYKELVKRAKSFKKVTNRVVFLPKQLEELFTND